MAGKRRRKLKSLAETITNYNEEKKDMNELQSWSEIPTELLELIISRLNLEDNIRVSSVCKRWNSIAISVRVANQSPWILYFPKSGNLHEFYDPSKRVTYACEIPELVGSRACYSKDGWLLLYKPTTNRVFFFNPFTQDSVNMPSFEINHQIVAFSSAPTSSECILFSIKHMSPTVVAISTCHPGATDWTTVNYANRLPFVSSIWNKVIFVGGLFYCLSLTGWVGVYDPLKRTWDVLPVPPPKCPDHFFSKNWWKGKFIAEHKGEILVIYTCCNENPIIFKLDQTEMGWVEMKTLAGVTLFVSFLSSHSRTDLLGLMRNSIYFSKVRFFGKRCISYSVDKCRYYPCKRCYDWGEQDPFESIWIEPPEELSTFI